MGKNRELNEFERGQVIGLFISGLNPIEHLWHELERRLRKRSVHPKNFYELEEALQEEWKRIPSETYINLIKSMPRRIEACIKNQGWPTKY